MNRQQLMSRVGRTWPVVYSNGPFAIWDRDYANFKAAPFRGRFEAKDNVYVDRTPRWLLRWPSRKPIDAITLRLAARRWQQKLDDFGDGPVVAHVVNPDFVPYLEYLRYDLLVYHAIDLYKNYPDFGPEQAEQESFMLRNADLVVGSSWLVAKELNEDSGREVMSLPNGVDFASFSQRAAIRPPEMVKIPRPRIGYSGALNKKFDFDLIADLATRRPDWHFTLVGPVGNLDADGASAYDRARTLANVHFLGVQPHDRVAAYMQEFDVGMMCYKTGGLWTAAAYPLKLHEYLACGLPLVSADLQIIREEFSDVAWVARDHDEWEQAIQRALAGDGPGTPEHRRAVASTNDWARRADTLREMIEGSLAEATKRR